MSLTGRRVLVTRAGSAWPDLVRILDAAGALAEFRPTTVQVAPNDRGPADEALAALASYRWIAFSSSNGVAFFVERLAGRGVEPGRLSTGIAVVGAATARAAEAAGLRVDRVAPRATSVGLLELLSAVVHPGERVLMVAPETESSLSREQLGAVRGEVDVVPFYRTEPAPDAAAIAAELVGGAYEAAVFTAPSALRALIGKPGVAAALELVRRVAIGPTTARALEQTGLPAHAVAAAPDAESVAAALASLW